MNSILEQGKPPLSEGDHGASIDQNSAMRSSQPLKGGGGGGSVSTT